MMDSDYPMLRLIGRFGGWMAVAVGAVPLAMSLGAVLLGWSPWWIPVGILAAAIGFAVMRSYIELVRVMIDMLLPK